jgi:hypothetical protein
MAASTADERREVVFTDGASPRLIASGDRYVGGSLELEIRFEKVNPLCYAYSTNVGSSRVAATDAVIPPRAPAISPLGSLAPAAFTDVEQAFAAVTAAQDDLDELLHAAEFQVSLEAVWAACDGGGDFEAQRARVDSAAQIVAEKLDAGGPWRERLVRAQATALGAARIARQAETEGPSESHEVDSRRAAALESERHEQSLRSANARPERLEEAARDLAAAQRTLREAELRVARRMRAADLGRSADRLGEQVQKTVSRFDAIARGVNRARGLIAQSPTAIRRHFGSGETAAVVVERTRLERGEPLAGSPSQQFQVPAFETLSPVILDLSIGPALAIGSNTSKYETVWSPRNAEDNTSTWRVARTEQGLDADALISISAYIWKRRYFDDTVWSAWQLIPRPMIGISLRRPFDALYAGAQIDPIQYVNIGGGVRFATTEKLVGPQPLDRALIDTNGDPQPPVTRDEVTARGFITLTVSTNLIYRWLSRGL